MVVTDRERIANWAMLAGTLVLLAGLFFVMTRQPFEYIDDLAWLHKLSEEPFSDIPFARAWMDESPFYRPGAELMLKLLYSAFGFHLLPYRVVQFGTLLGLIAVSRAILRRLALPSMAILPFTVFLIGSPFTSGSIVWLSELPHIVVLICFGGGVACLLSEKAASWKLTICVSMFVIALSMKENGLALVIFYPFLARRHPLIATLAFGVVTIGYFTLRAEMLGSGMGLANASPVDHRAYIVNVISQVVALWTRLAKWGAPISELRYETPLQICSTALIASAAPSLRKNRTAILLTGTTIGCALFSYAYARDRHLALPAYAYGLMLMMAINTLSPRHRWLLFVAWLAWSAQAAITIRDIHRASIDIIEKVYRPNLMPIVPNMAPEVWAAGRSAALSLR